MKNITVYKKFINNKRDTFISVSSSSIKNSGFLSDFDLDSITEIITELTKVINGTLESFYWGQEQIMIDSESLTSYCFDEMNNTSLPNVNTQELLNLMIEIKDFKTAYGQPANLSNIITQAFNQIRSNPQSYKKWSHLIYYEVIINNITVALQLESEDFNLSASQYVNQLKIDV